MSHETQAFRLPVDRWYPVIKERRSRRAYDGRPPAAGELEALEAYCAAPGPFPAARVVLVRDVPPEVFVAAKEDRAAMPGMEAKFTGIAGSYGRVVGASCVLAFVGRVAGGAQDADPATGEGFAVEEQIGYTGEAAVLEATALGLNTCWITGFFSPSLTSRLIDAAPDEQVFGITPVGHAPAEPSRKERLFFRTGKPKKRRALEHIALGFATKDWPGWTVAGLRAVQDAPSAVNRQPWRFRLDGDTVILAADMADTGHTSRRVDCGIAMLHFELGVKHSGRDGAWEPPGTGKPLDVARWRPRR